MRKILTEEEIEQKRKRNKVIIGGVLALIMLLSTAGFAFINTSFNGGAKKEKYNGYEFIIAENGMWTTKLQGIDMYFRYSPGEINASELNIPPVSMGDYNGKNLYIDSDDTVVTSEIASFMQYFVFRVQRGCLDGKNCTDESLPLKNCTDESLIVIEDSNMSSLSKEDGCIFIKGTGSDKVRLADAFLYKLMGVI